MLRPSTSQRGWRRRVIARNDDDVLLIHLDETFELEGPSEGGQKLSGRQSVSAQLLDLYARSACEQFRSVFVLLPESSRERAGEMLSELGQVSPIWYTDDGVTSLPSIPRRGRVWMINGGQLPVIDWEESRTALRRHDTDVLVFGSHTESAPHYSESVLVDESGEVVKFKRHYCDSPRFADLWNGDASFLVGNSENALAVAAHVLIRGWGLESVGALTRRFSVQWSSTPCVSSDLMETLTHSLDLSTGSKDSAPSRSIRLSEQRIATVDEFSRSTWQNEQQRSEAARADNHTLELDLQEGWAHPSSNVTRNPAGGTVYLAVKRLIDFTAAVIGLILLLPLFVIVALLVKCSSRGPVLFGHRRQGIGGKEFYCWKFRSMDPDADANQAELRKHNEVDGPQFKIAEDPRLTKLGTWIRRYNIDELPQLVNVLLGQMSFVGPRPSPDDENQLCPAWRRTRLSVKPGVTGLWQVFRIRGQHGSDFQEWIYYDLEYARHRSLLLDLLILLNTPLAIFAPQHLDRLAKRLERRGICTRAVALRREYRAR